jgi:sodium-dependent dicarboxylate transporter 2/3/5
MSEPATAPGQRVQSPPWAARLGLLAGPLLALAAWLALPKELGDPARACGGVAVLMAAWWMTEAIPLEATALLPLVLLPLTGVYPAEPFKRVAAAYADPAIFLFLGGFVIALAIERWGLHRRLALGTLRVVGTSPARLVGGFMLATALVSMWISNTATTVMMLPIALAVVHLLDDALRQPALSAAADLPHEAAAASFDDARHFATSLLLGVAYAASLGGFATLVGTPPNVFFKGYLRDRQIELDFGRWMLFACPLSLAYLALGWWLMTRWLFPVRLREIPGGRALIASQWRALGKLSRGEWIVLLVFLATAGLWIGSGPLKRWDWLITRLPWLLKIDDYWIAMAGALSLFLIPVDPERHQFAVDWKTAAQLPWGVLLLFGGGLSLAAALTDSGLAAWLGRQAVAVRHWPAFAQIVLVVAVIVFTGELTNNLAAVVALLPILFEAARGMGHDPLLLCVPAVVAASCGFMLPVATPPNAIVFGTGHIRLREMIRAGLWLDLVGIALVPVCTWLWGRAVLGLGG